MTEQTNTYHSNEHPEEVKLPNVHIFSAPEDKRKFGSLVKQWFLSTKVIYLILIAVITIELFLGARTLLSPLPQANKLQPLDVGRIILKTDKKSVKEGDKFLIDVFISTGGNNTIGTDLGLKFDPGYLEILENGFTVGKLYPDYPGVNIDNKEGTVLASGIASFNNKGFNGTGKFATLNLRALKSGRTSVTIDYRKGSTVDSNIIEETSSADILAEVVNLELNIGSDEPISQSTGSKSCQSYTQLCWNLEGSQSVQSCLKGGIKEGVCGFDPYLTTECTKCGSKD